MSRYILHCDLDCFFAAVEIRDNPEYIGKPVIIGADPEKGKGRGVVSTCSYEARIFGLHSGMPISQAYQRCSHGIYLKPNGEKYRKVSKDVMTIIKSFSEIFQQVGSDEAYLELTDICTTWQEVEKVAEKIQRDIYQKIGITISIGCAPTKSLAKIASDFKKPNGITIFTNENYKNLLKNLDITRISGIGKKSKNGFYKKGIKTIGDIQNTSLPHMIDLFGKNGKWIWEIANGLDNRKVKEFHEGRKSISAERTFYTDTGDFQEILSRLEEINKRIHNTIIKHHITYKTVTLKVRFEGFQTFTRSKSYGYHIQDENCVLNIVLELFKEFSIYKKKIRLVGIKLSNFEKNQKVRQTDLMRYIPN